MVLILLTVIGGFVANTYTTVYINKLDSDDWDQIHEALSSDNIYSLILGAVILSYVIDGLNFIHSLLKKLMKCECVKDGNCKCLVCFNKYMGLHEVSTHFVVGFQVL